MYITNVSFVCRNCIHRTTIEKICVFLIVCAYPTYSLHLIFGKSLQEEIRAHETLGPRGAQETFV